MTWVTGMSSYFIFEWLPGRHPLHPVPPITGLGILIKEISYLWYYRYGGCISLHLYCAIFEIYDAVGTALHMNRSTFIIMTHPHEVAYKCPCGWLACCIGNCNEKNSTIWMIILIFLSESKKVYWASPFETHTPRVCGIPPISIFFWGGRGDC